MMEPELDMAEAQKMGRAGGKTIAYSVIIEWENVLLAGRSRALEGLRRLAVQIRSMREQGIEGEVILVVDADDRSTASLSAAIGTAFGADAGTVRVIAIGERRYYEKKNAGAAVANGAVLVFLDSDVIPEERWLECLLSSFLETDTAVVAGATYLEPATFYARAVAAFWFFPPRSEEEGLVSADTIFGNNIAFRREVFLQYPYPVLNQFRGQLGSLVRDLREKGVRISLQRGARCAHPPPNGVAHFVRRALCEGYDNIVISRRASGRSRLAWRHTYWSVRSWLHSSSQAIRDRRKALQLGPIDLLAAWTLAVCYIALMALGEVMTRLRPDIVPRRFSI